MVAVVATTIAAAKTLATGLLPLGIHFGLDETIYHSDPALGSTDLRHLLQGGPSYWWDSPLNPNREQDEDTPARLRGRAMHKLVLEGEAFFDKLFVRSPHSEDMTPAEKSAATKALKAKLPPGMSILPGKDYDRTVIAAAMITRNPSLQGAFSGGAAEVSVLWERSGIRRKARFDYMKPRGIGDLKSHTNIKRIEFPRSCREAIANWRYEVQAAHYLEARAAVPSLVGAGMVHGAHDAAALKVVVAAKQFAFQWVFFAAAGAPVTWSTILSPENPIVEIAQREIERATDIYRAYMDRFGPDQIWLLEDKPEELAIEELPAWWARS